MSAGMATTRTPMAMGCQTRSGESSLNRMSSPASPMKTRARRVLLVEDNPLFQTLVLGAVRKLGRGWEVLACKRGREALELLRGKESPFDLALVDLGLPDINGVEVISAARESDPDLPIMVISVISAETSVLAAIRAGARGYILKSDSESAMAEAISQVLEGNYPISPALARTLFRLAGSPAEGSVENAFGLTPRELETLRNLAKGNAYEEVARLMGISLSTVQTNVRNLYRKLDAHSQLQAVNKARDHGLL